MADLLVILNLLGIIITLLAVGLSIFALILLIKVLKIYINKNS